ncbi:uncharacterized protein Desi [Lepeophtheirus salmonis]|uniref:uncharacterized protein Desi n=1 Tax=Lepeophtheirus salmonis TaxID=72036 RepID=UPI001AE4A3E3|nr:uncharacterized protein LOC121129990 [Lepeophtheirus salmonis]
MKNEQIFILVICLSHVLCPMVSAGEGKRKKLRRKIILTPSTTTIGTTSIATTLSTTIESESPMEGDYMVSFSDEDKVPRGFLDDYYAQFENRLFKSKYPKEHLTISQKSSQQRRVKKQPSQQLEKFSEKYTQYLTDTQKRKNAQRISYEDGQLSHLYSPSSPYSSFPQSLGSNYDSKTQLKGNDGPLKQFFDVSGISSQSIQLGLTFTVPFLSFPLSAIGSIINGVTNGSTDLFNFDTQSLMIGALIVAGSIFLLPQFIYWLTGVNLSAFTWGRNDDSSNISSLINTVDQALYRYDVDTRSCMAETLCKRMRSDDNNFFTSLISKFMGSDFLKNIMGKDKIKEIQSQRCPATSNCPWDAGPMTKFAMDLMKKRGGDILSMAKNTNFEEGDDF